MEKMSFAKKIVVARVLNRYVGQSLKINCNRAVIAAMEKWIGADKPVGETRSISPLQGS